MDSHAKLFGHPIHPMLITIPIGVLTTSVIFDIVHLITNVDAFATSAFWCIAIGVVGGLLAALFGLWDWLHIPGGTRAKAIGLWHGGGNVVVVTLFIVSWLLRLMSNSYGPSALAYVCSFAGILLALVTAWLGGELVDRLGVGVDQGANLDAPNSLSGKPAGRRIDDGVSSRG
jgi:uncharacterized membrane protein